MFKEIHCLYPFIFNLPISLYLKYVYCIGNIVGWFKNYLIIIVFWLLCSHIFTFNVIIDMFEIVSTSSLFDFCLYPESFYFVLFCFSIFCFLPSSGTLKHCYCSILIFTYVLTIFLSILVLIQGIKMLLLMFSLST